MALIWKPQSNLVYQDWIDRIIADSQASCKELSDWENKFIDSMNNRIIMKQPISELMAKKLEEIYVKYSN